MAGLNKVILIGNLGRDPELRYTPNGSPVAEFSLATSEKWKDKEGNPQERTEWHNVVAWGRQAEICGEYLHKGRQVYVEGRIQTRSWDDKDGNKRYKTEVVARQVLMLGARGEGQGPGAKADKAEPQKSSPPDTVSEPDPDYSDEDIPF
jgi:single-strand DNA-binding protein